MLSCKEFVELQNQKVDGINMTVWQRISLKFHAFLCVYCRRYLEQLQLVDKLAPKISHQHIHEHGIEECLAKLTKNQSDAEK